MIRRTANNEFHISTRSTSYVFRVNQAGFAEHLYYGRAIPFSDNYGYLTTKAFSPAATATIASRADPSFSMDTACLEYSFPGKGDYKRPSVLIEKNDGSWTTHFRFLTAEIHSGKPIIHPLPSSCGDELESLIVFLTDVVSGLNIELCYTPFESCDVISRCVRVHNCTEKSVILREISSMQLDLPPGEYDMITFDGFWGRERHLNRRELSGGEYSVGSITGASSSRHNPFFMVCDRETGEYSGDVYGFNLIYSGNHIASCEVSPHGIVRVQNGINPHSFKWTLEPGSYFYAPEAILSFSHDGFNGLSAHMHDFVNNHIVRGSWKNKPRPVLINSWESFYFDVNEEKIAALADISAPLGIELLVLDDGWFGVRDDDTTSLGDWFDNREKFPNGIAGLAERVNRAGMSFGIWVEPEMVSPVSSLYTSHPDWAVTADGYEPSLSRNQLTLDLTNPIVREYIIEAVSGLLSSANISYVKWDYNRNHSDVFSHLPESRQGEFFHRYILGLYEIFDTLTTRFPEVLFESCASGGNRFDLGMLCYTPQIWTSDCTDPLERLAIQCGTSYGYPLSTMGCHVSASPNHQTLRESTLPTRFNCAAFGLLGYELDPAALTAGERAEITRQTAFYKARRRLFQYGRFRRLESRDKYIFMCSPLESGSSVLGYFTDRVHPSPPLERIRLAYLDAGAVYHVSAIRQPLFLKDGPELSAIDDTIAPGAALMYSGLHLPERQIGSSGHNPLGRVIRDGESRLYEIKNTGPADISLGAVTHEEIPE